ncbi:MAG: LAGLIDADG family homing endonuclease [Actinomycetota bacterium]
MTGPYDRRHRDRWSKNPMYFVQIYREAVDVVQRLWPQLGSAKRAKTLHDAWPDLSMINAVPEDETGSRNVFSRENLAWAAGFFDAEGCFSTTARVGVSASITQTDRELLDRFRGIVGCGTVYGPYQTRAADRFPRKPHYFYKAHGRERVQALLAMLWTWLGTAKKRQALDRLEWTSTCRRGHTKKPGHAGCADCTRAYWETFRALRREPGVGEGAVSYLVAG